MVTGVAVTVEVVVKVDVTETVGVVVVVEDSAGAPVGKPVFATIPSRTATAMAMPAPAPTFPY